MKKLLLSILISLMLTFITPGLLAQSNHDEAELLKAAREIINEVGTCTLITLDGEAKPRARAMEAFLPDEEFVIWFGTNSISRKVNQIINNPAVTLYYYDKQSASYVTIRGEAKIVNDIDEKKRYWKEGWSSFYPDYPDGFSLIKVVPEWLEVISLSRGIVGESLTWLPPRVVF